MTRRRLILTGVLAAGALAALAFGIRQVASARCFTLTGATLCRVETAAPLVALTVDDGPTQAGVDALLPILARHGAKATFFLVGADVARRPDLARRLLAAGHEIGNHSYSHARMVFRPAAFYDREIARTQQALAAAGGHSGLFRPPYGKKLVGLPAAVERQGLTMVTWDVEDPQTTDPAAFARQVVDEARPGSIVLVHAMNAGNATARAALPQILEGLRRKGLRAVTVGELVASARSAGP